MKINAQPGFGHSLSHRTYGTLTSLHNKIEGGVGLSGNVRGGNMTDKGIWGKNMKKGKDKEKRRIGRIRIRSDPCLFGRIRIRTLGPDPDPNPSLQ
jgi:hypothetical protein